MADGITVRKYSNVKSNVGVLKTNQFWEIILQADANTSTPTTDIKDKIKFVTDTVSGIPGEIEMEKVEIDVMGYHFTFPGKMPKNGTLTWTVFEDEKGNVTKFYRELMKKYMIGGKGSSDANGIRDTKGKPDPRFTVTVKLYNNEGSKVWRTWTFDNCLLTMSYAMDLGQEVAPLQYTFNADFSYFDDTEGDSGTTW